MKLVTLLVAVVAFTVPVSHGWSDLESSGHGKDGSADFTKDFCFNTDCELFKCSPLSEVSLSEVLTNSRCYSICFEKALKLFNFTVALQAALLDPVKKWSTVSVETLRQHCALYNEVHYCSIGCQLNSVSNMTCVFDCMEDCRSDTTVYLPHSICTKQCNINSCSRGCQSYSELNTISSRGSTPPVPSSDKIKFIPYSSPHIHNAGVFKIVYTDKNDTHSSLLTDNIFISSFIIEICIGPDQLITHYWMMSLSDTLLMEQAMICQYITVRIAAANKYGMSDFSSPITVFVYGDIYPSGPDHPFTYSIQVSIENDNRFSYWEHAVVNISWQKPNNYRYATGFEVHIRSHDKSRCGSSLTQIIDRNKTHYTWRSSRPSYSPFNNCTYGIQIFSLPFTDFFPGRPSILPVHITTTNPIPDNYTYSITMSSRQTLTRDWGRIHVFSFFVAWQLPDNPQLAEGIDEFKLYLWYEPFNQEQLFHLRNDTVNYTEGVVRYTGGFNDIQSRSDGYFIIELETIYSVISKTYIKSNSTIKYDARPLPPSVITGVKVDQLYITVNGTLHLMMIWPPPNVRNGQLYYLVYVGLKELNGSMLPAESLCIMDTRSLPEHSTFVYTINDYPYIYYLSFYDVSINHHILPLNETYWTIYIQVAAVNINTNRSSNWSVPYKYNLRTYLQDIYINESSPTSSPVQSYTDYIVLTVVFAVAMIVFLIATIFCCIILNRKLKTNKRKYVTPCIEVSNQTEIGTGTFGIVYKASLVNNNIDVFVQMFEGYFAGFKLQKQLDEFEKLINSVSDTTTGLSHILSIFGQTSINGQEALVYQFCDRGDLLTYLHYQKQNDFSDDDNIFDYIDVEILTTSKLVDYCKQISSAMCFLSKHGIVHNDLACRNVYIAKNGIVKVAQLGIVRHGPRTDVYIQHLHVPLRWMAIEVIRENNATSQSDVWSFGILLWEIVTFGEFPYKEVKNKDLLKYLVSGNRLPCPNGCSFDFYQVMKSCWDTNSHSRPTFQNLYDTLTDFVQNEQQCQSLFVC